MSLTSVARKSNGHKRGGYKPGVPDPFHQRAMRILRGTAVFEDRHIPDHEELVELIGLLRSMGCVIVFTTGVWDILHVGHCRYIQQGKDEARKLYPNAEHIIMVVGYDTDEFTKARKGPNRPVVSEGERAEIISYLRAVDIIVPQYKADQLFKVIKHDVRVISVSTKDLPKQKEIRAQCDKLVNLPPQAEVSTTIRLREMMLDGRREEVSNFKGKLLKLVEGLEIDLKKV